MRSIRNDLNTELSGVALTADEKAHMRSHVEAFMREHPLPTPSDDWYGIRSPFRLRPLHTVRATLAVAVIMLLVGSSVATAAEGSLPGDILYPVKVNVNEEVRAAVTVSPEAKAKWDAERAARRLQEAEKLAVEGRLDATTTARLEAKFEEHASQSIAHAQESKDIATKVAVHSELEATLEAHKSVINNLIKTNDSLEEPLESVADAVSEQAEVSEDARIAAEREATESTTTVPKQLVKNIRDEVREVLDDVERDTDDLQDDLDPAIADLIDSRFNASVRAYDKGKKLYKEEQLNDALVVFQEAQRTAIQAQVLLSISESLIPEEKDEESEETATTTEATTTPDTAEVLDAATTTDTNAETTASTTATTTATHATTTFQKLQIEFGH